MSNCIFKGKKKTYKDYKDSSKNKDNEMIINDRKQKSDKNYDNQMISRGGITYLHYTIDHQLKKKLQ